MESNLRQAIDILYDMEINNYMMTRSIKEIDRKISGLGRIKNIAEPTLSEPYTEVKAWAGGGMFIGAGLGILIGLFSSCGGGLGAGIINVLKLGFIGYVVGILSGTILGMVRKSAERSKDKKKYQEDLREYSRKIANDDRRVELENQQIAYLKKQKANLCIKLAQSNHLLKQFYNKVNIDETYRNLVPIGYMVEFMRLGIANKLEGADGLYYLVRRELRDDMLRRSLDEISSKLDVIIDNQSRLYQELKNTNKKVDKLIQTTIDNSRRMENSLNKIEYNTGIAAYNSQRAAKEASYQSFLLTYDFYNN